MEYMMNITLISEETSDHPPRLENFFPLDLSTVEAASLEKARCRDSCCSSHWKRDSSISR